MLNYIKRLFNRKHMKYPIDIMWIQIRGHWHVITDVYLDQIYSNGYITVYVT